MKRVTLYAVALAAVLLSTSCTDNEESPYILLRDDSRERIIIPPGGTIEAPLGTTVTVLVETGYNRFGDNGVEYELGIGNDSYRLMSDADGLTVTSRGVFNDLCVEKATVEIFFDPGRMSPGDFVSLRVRDRTTLSRLVTFLVTESTEVPVLPEEPEVPVEPLLPVVPDEPLLPIEPLLPVVPDEPLLPIEPLLPVVPDEPELPIGPLLPIWP